MDPIAAHESNEVFSFDVSRRTVLITCHWQHLRPALSLSLPVRLLIAGKGSIVSAHREDAHVHSCARRCSRKVPYSPCRWTRRIMARVIVEARGGVERDTSRGCSAGATVRYESMDVRRAFRCSHIYATRRRRRPLRVFSHLERYEVCIYCLTSSLCTSMRTDSLAVSLALSIRRIRSL